jgi:hypothetical protein
MLLYTFGSNAVWSGTRTLLSFLLHLLLRVQESLYIYFLCLKNLQFKKGEKTLNKLLAKCIATVI